MNRTLLGSLDPRFFGIKIAYDSFEDFKFATQVYSRELDAPRLAQMRSGGLISERQVWIATAIEHELRHYHDSLMSAHWLGIQSLRNQCALNTQSMLSVLGWFVSRHGGNCLALPLRRWFALGVGERESRVDAWPRTNAETLWRPVPFPLSPLPKSPPSTFWPEVPDALRSEAEQLAGQLFSCTMGYERIEQLNLGRTTGEWANLRPRHVYEISAITAQLYAAHITFDDKAAHDLRHSLQAHGMRDYGGHFAYVLSFLLACKGIDRGNVLDVANSLATWAMLGPPDRTEDLLGQPRSDRELTMSCPAARLAFAFEVIKARGFESDTPTYLFDLLDKMAGTTDHRSAMEWVDTMVERKSMQYAAMAENTGRHDIFSVSQQFDIYKEQRGKMMQVLREDMAAYANPNRYMNEIARFPRPAIRIDFAENAPIMRYEGDTLEAVSSGVLDWEQNQDGSYNVRAYVGDRPDDIDLNVLYEYENLQVFTDALITGKVPAEQFAKVKQLFAGLGISVFRA